MTDESLDDFVERAAKLIVREQRVENTNKSTTIDWIRNKILGPDGLGGPDGICGLIPGCGSDSDAVQARAVTLVKATPDSGATPFLLAELP